MTRAKRKKAFTLIETILAMTISGIVMFGCAVAMFNLFKTLEVLEQNWTLKQHADGVEKFLRNLAMSSRFCDSDKIEEKLRANSSNTIVAAKLPKDIRTSQYYLCFGVQADVPFLPTHRGISPEKHCFLVDDNEGLSLIWQYAVSEDEDGERAVFKSAISKFVKEIYYIFQDDDTWTEEREINTSESSMPSYIKLVFEHNGERVEKIIKLSGMLDYQIAK